MDFEIGVSSIQRKLSFGSINKKKLKEIIFELNKMKATIRNPSQINQGKLTTLKPMKIT